ncbi:site-specific DNA-methyltransferase (plasmid) [Clostridium tetani]|uniref:DNA-methyltransferase n=1 Tax=Clostridium tetani TaxID=1513 RepID=UPI0029550027|nr:site-specific DNA-methyltransferase [Clostridium tetani]BDR74236.1 site-specific DNA-methyltransferase [Clostridium tetani]
MDTNIILNEDFLLNNLPNESVDLIVTDPPYKTITGGDSNGANSERPKGMLSGNRKLFKHQKLKIFDWMPQLYRILKEQSHCYIFTNVVNIEDMLRESKKAGFKLHNILVWQKNNCTPSQYYMKNCEYVLFLRKGKAKWINDIGGSKTVHEYLIKDNPVTITVNNIIGNKLHPTEKPVDLLKLYISNSSDKGDIVLDPFAGSGSTLVACKELNRRYIGYEIDKKYYNIAKERINK